MPRQPKLDDIIEQPTDGSPPVTRSQRVIELIRAGNYASTAAEACGIGRATFYRWMDGKGPRYREFRDAVLRARAQAEIQAVTTVQLAMRGGQVTGTTVDENGVVTGRTYSTADGRLALEYLSRVAPMRFGRRTQVDLGRAAEEEQSAVGGEAMSEGTAQTAKQLTERFHRWQATQVEQLPEGTGGDGTPIVDADIVDEGTGYGEGEGEGRGDG